MCLGPCASPPPCRARREAAQPRFRYRRPAAWPAIPSCGTRPAAVPAPAPASASRLSASDRNGSGPGVTIAVRHRSISGIVPGRVSRGSSPARSSEDLPEPLAPMTSRKGARSRPSPPRATARSLRDGEVAAEEDAAAIGLEGRQTGKRRAVEHAVPHRTLRQEAPPRQPLAQAILDLAREVVGRLHSPGTPPGTRRCCVLNQSSKKPFRRLPLRLDLGSVGRVERDRRRVRVAKDIDVGQVLAGLARVDRRQDLIGRAARIGLARRHAGKRGREPRAQPGAEDRNDQSQSAASGICLLKGVVGRVVGWSPSGSSRSARAPRIRCSGARRRVRRAAARRLRRLERRQRDEAPARSRTVFLLAARHRSSLVCPQAVE